MNKHQNEVIISIPQNITIRWQALNICAIY